MELTTVGRADANKLHGETAAGRPPLPPAFPPSQVIGELEARLSADVPFAGGVAGSPEQEDAVRKAYLLRRVRHGATRKVIVDLVNAWRAEGIETLLVKGFHLAEHVYPDSAWRPYGDVDLAIRAPSRTEAELAEAAARVARQAGWRVVWWFGEKERPDSVHSSEYDGHELMILYHDRAGLAVDVHRRLVHGNVERPSGTRRLDAITAAVWNAAEDAELGGVPIKVPSPVDAVLIGVIAARSWSGDDLAIRQSDYLDLTYLYAKGGISRADVEARARDLGMRRTAARFLSHCDPEAGVLRLVPPNPVALFFYDLWIWPERSHRTLERFLRSLRRTPGDLFDIARELPGVTRQVIRTRSGRSPEWVKAGAGQLELDRETWRRTLFGIRRALQINGTWAKRQPELALACVYASLVKRGYAVDLRGGDGRIWFEYGGNVLYLGVLAEGAPGAAKSKRGWYIGARATDIAAS